MSQTVISVQLLVALAVLAFPLWLGVIAIRLAYRAGWNRRFLVSVEDDPPPMVTPPPLAAEGSASLVMMAALAAGLGRDRGGICRFTGPAASAVAEISDTADLRLTDIQVDAAVSPARPGETQIADVDNTLGFEVRSPGIYRLLDPGFVMTEVRLSSDRYLRVVPNEQGTWLHADRKGEYKVTYRYLAPVASCDGAHHLNLDIPAALKNQVVLHLVEDEMDVFSSAAVLLDTEDREVGSETRLVFASTRTVDVGWRRRAPPDRRRKSPLLRRNQ